MYYINELDEEQREAFLNAIAHVAWADGGIAGAEEAFVEGVASIYELSDEAVKRVMKPKAENEILSEVTKIDDPTIQLCLIRELFSLGYADGDLSDREILVIGKIAEVLDVPMDKVEEISDWVLEGIEWQERGEELFKKTSAA